MGRLNLALVGVALGALSCSGSNGQPPAKPPADSATLLSPTTVVQVTLDGSRIFGPQVELSRDENSLRGRGPLGVVDLRKSGDSLRGFVGGGPTELYVEPEQDGFSLRGLFSGVLGDLEVRSDRIQGQLGTCQYNLRRYASEGEGSAYTGQRVCGRRWMEPTTFALSPGIKSLQPMDRAALVAVLLGR